uniref:Nucleocapsid protein n=1 Tax=Blattodean orthomyxo-related virus OKIAV181 TaxID=2746285 RepID=A0A7D7FLJ5_9ORTO|nr:nucleocapsid protein [Blattodean orthomyxo-related virus OKIAV181]
MSAPVPSTSAENQMETGSEDQRPNKRKAVIMLDPDTSEELSDPKKPRIALDETKKIAVLKTILESARYIFELAQGVPSSASLNLNVNMQIANIVFTCHNIKRQAASGLIGNMANKSGNKDFTLNYLGKSYAIPRENALTVVESIAKKYGMLYKPFKTDDPENWYGVAGPYLCFFVGFGLRYTELRIGHGHMPTKKSGDSSYAFPVFKYGLYGSHHVLLEGCTFPPEKRSSMAQSLGPMTVLLCYLKSDSKYEEKWKKACKRSMSHIPLIDDILTTLKGKKAYECASIISNLADTLLLTTSRQAQRAFFPILLTYIVSTTKGIKSPVSWNDSFLKVFNASGQGAFLCYKMISDLKGITLAGKFTQQQASQVLYHCIFGTYKEDLGVLSAITNNGTWSTREELGKSFQGAGTSTTVAEITPIRQVYYSKLSSANQTGLLASSYLQISSVPVFSGSRVQTFSDEFFENLGKRAGASTGGKTIESLQGATKQLLQDIIEEVNKRGKKLEMGTVSWRDMASLTTEQHGEEVNLVVNTTGKFFLGRNST